MKKNLVLTGMMGVGKSTIGKSLSERLNKKFIDIDKIIENEENMTIKKIFETKGEKYFRKVEEKISLEYLNKSDFVFALGGGAFTNEVIRSFVLKKCISFWLDLNLASLKERVSDSSKRPLLNQKELGETLSNLYESRKDIYALANYKFDCNNSGKSLIIDKIVKIYETKRN